MEKQFPPPTPPVGELALCLPLLGSPRAAGKQCVLTHILLSRRLAVEFAGGRSLKLGNCGIPVF